MYLRKAVGENLLSVQCDALALYVWSERFDESRYFVPIHVIIS